MAPFGSCFNIALIRSSSNKIDVHSNQLSHFAPTNQLVEDFEPIVSAINGNGYAFEDNHGDELEAEGDLTDSDHDFDEK